MVEGKIFLVFNQMISVVSMVDINGENVFIILIAMTMVIKAVVDAVMVVEEAVIQTTAVVVVALAVAATIITMATIITVAMVETKMMGISITICILNSQGMTMVMCVAALISIMICILITDSQGMTMVICVAAINLSTVHIRNGDPRMETFII
jgi:hypothetical protein